MPSPLIRNRGNLAVFAPQFCASINYYSRLATFERVVIDTGMRYDKRFKTVHRCTIADVRGPLRLTVPVENARSALLAKSEEARLPLKWSDIFVSSHGEWWSDHIVSLESAYGRTPYFEYYFDRIRPLLSNRRLPITELDTALDSVIRSILGLETQVEALDASALKEDFIDFRHSSFETERVVPYYQVRQDKLGFLPGMSILDLIFNMGPEAQLILHEMAE